MKHFIIRLLISIALLGGVILFFAPHVHPDDIRQAISLFSWPVIFLSFLLSFLISFVKAGRFYQLVHRVGLRISFWQSCKVFLASQSTTPLPGGEAMRVLLLKKETRASSSHVVVPVLAQAILELIAAVAIVIVGSFFYPSVRWLAALLLILLVPFLVLFFYSTGVKYCMGWIMKWKRCRPWATKFLEAQNEMRTLMFPTHKKKSLFTISVLGFALVADAVGAYLILFFSSRLGLQLNFFDAIYLYATTVAIQGLLWIIPGGLGVTEGGMLLLLSLWKMPLGKAISLVAIFRVATLLFPVVLGLILLIIFYGKFWLVDIQRHS